MLTTVCFLVYLLCISQINGRVFHSREDSLTVMREKCTQNPSAEECTRIKLQMEDLLRKCTTMVTPVSACQDVKTKYCFIWPRELYCFTSSGQVTTKSPIGFTDSDWNQIPSDPNELKSRGDYCVTHQIEQKCKNLLSAIKSRYEECSKRPKTDPSCQTFKINLCAAFPKFSPCLNGESTSRKRASQLRHLLQMRRKVSTW